MSNINCPECQSVNIGATHGFFDLMNCRNCSYNWPRLQNICPQCKGNDVALQSGQAGQMLYCQDCKDCFPIPTKETEQENSPLRIIQEMHNTFKERNQMYGDSFQSVGEIIKILFPDGVKLSSVEEFRKFSAFNFIVVKIIRFAPYMDHTDSIHDVGVYCAILESMMSKEGDGD